MFNSETQSLDEYLSQIARELRALPAPAPADELREIEAHLRALVEAAQQLEDISQAEATAAALKQFGVPRKVGRNLRRAWQRKQPEAWWRAVVAPLFALAFWFFIAWPFTQGFYTFYLRLHGIDFTSNQPVGAGVSDAVFANCLNYEYFIGFFMMLTASYVMGLISPKRSKFGISALLACGFLPQIVSCIITGTSFPLEKTLAIVFVFLLPAAIGTYLGARRGNKISALTVWRGKPNVQI